MPGLAAYEHDLTAPGGGPFPTTAQERDLLLTTDEWREPGGVRPA